MTLRNTIAWGEKTRLGTYLDLNVLNYVRAIKAPAKVETICREYMVDVDIRRVSDIEVTHRNV